MIDSKKYGISFSLKQCRNLGLDPHKTLDWLIEQGWRRFRLMSYWDEHEKQAGQYDFSELDWQIAAITKAGGVITLCLGAKQPRWPEYHWPNWAWEGPKADRDKALSHYVQKVVERYRAQDNIVSWQLENEALLQGFGSKIEIDRLRLREEYALVKSLDAERPVAMSTSNGWGIPLRRPRSDRVGFSYYPVMHKKGSYHKTVQRPWLHRVRRSLIQTLLGHPVFIHELQCEPWGPEPIWKMTTAQQDESMSVKQIARNISLPKKVKVYPIDLWGAEWWYWRWLQGDKTIYRAVMHALQN